MKTKFGLAALDAIQKNYKIILDRLIKGYEKVTGKQPEGIDLTMIKREAYEKAEDSAKVVDMEGKTLDPSKPIMGGKQQLDDFNLSKDDPMGDLEKIIKGEGDTGLPKNYTRPFGDNIRDAYRKAGRSREDATEMIKALDSPGAKKSYEIMEEALGVRLYGDETFEELMQIKETGVHPRGEPPIKKADGGRVAFRGGGMDASQDDFGGNTASDTGPGGGATDTGPGFTGDSIGPSAPQDLGFIGSGPTVSPTFKKGPIIVSAPDKDPRFAGYTPSGFDPGRRNIFQKGFNLVKRTVTNPFLQNVGLGILGGPIGAKFGLSRQIDMFNKARAVKGLLESLGPIADQTMEDVLEEDIQTTALYKDGGLASMFVEKR